MLGSGWCTGMLATAKNWNLYGKNTGLLLQLNITCEDGTLETVILDECWKTSLGGYTIF